MGALRLLVGVAAFAGLASPAAAVNIRVQPMAQGGAIQDARVRMWDSSGGFYPGNMNAPLLCHIQPGTTYFYPDGVTPVSAPAGSYTIQAWHGPEWQIAQTSLNATRDTVVNLTMTRFDDLRPRGWYSGDLHVHTAHPPIQYSLDPLQTLRVAHAEGLSVVEVLNNDDDDEFEGEPSGVSDSLATLYYSYEYRNQFGGHAALAGLVSPIGSGCCASNEAPWPMLVDIQQLLAPQGGLMVLAHPVTTSDYEARSGWPGMGLGREMQVLAALGGVGALDVVSYSNDPDTMFTQWYDLLSSGLDVPASAGTDCVMNWVTDLPPGGWRVYANVAPGAQTFHSRWLAAVGAGRTFVTSGPLIPRFEIAGIAPGGTLDVPSDTIARPVRIEAECVFGISRIALIADGVERWTATLNGATHVDTSFTFESDTPRWMAVRVDGMTAPAMLLGLVPVAHTSAVRVTRAGDRRPLAASCARAWDAVQRYEDFAIVTGDHATSWPAWEHDSLLARTARARAFYGRPFVLASGSFSRLTTDDSHLRWSASHDPEAFDRVRYEADFDTLSGLPAPFRVTTDDTTMIVSLPRFGLWWCRVYAVDRGGNRTLITGGTFAIAGGTADVASNTPGRAKIFAFPNPARGPVRLTGFGDDVAVYDLGGRRVASLGDGIVRDGGGHDWQITHSSRPAPGVYLARSAATGANVRVVVLP